MKYTVYYTDGSNTQSDDATIHDEIRRDTFSYAIRNSDGVNVAYKYHYKRSAIKDFFGDAKDEFMQSRTFALVYIHYLKLKYIVARKEEKQKIGNEIAGIYFHL